MRQFVISSRVVRNFIVLGFEAALGVNATVVGLPVVIDTLASIIPVLFIVARLWVQIYVERLTGVDMVPCVTVFSVGRRVSIPLSVDILILYDCSSAS